MPTKEFPDVMDCRVLINGEWIQLGTLTETTIILSPDDLESYGGYDYYSVLNNSPQVILIEGYFNRHQVRTHRSKRVNKKWARRYGYKFNVKGDK